MRVSLFASLLFIFTITHSTYADRVSVIQNANSDYSFLVDGQHFEEGVVGKDYFDELKAYGAIPFALGPLIKSFSMKRMP